MSKMTPWLDIIIFVLMLSFLTPAHGAFVSHAKGEMSPDEQTISLALVPAVDPARAILFPSYHCPKSNQPQFCDVRFSLLESGRAIMATRREPDGVNNSSAVIISVYVLESRDRTSVQRGVVEHGGLMQTFPRSFNANATNRTFSTWTTASPGVVYGDDDFYQLADKPPYFSIGRALAQATTQISYETVLWGTNVLRVNVITVRLLQGVASVRLSAAAASAGGGGILGNSTALFVSYTTQGRSFVAGQAIDVFPRVSVLDSDGGQLQVSRSGTGVNMSVSITAVHFNPERVVVHRGALDTLDGTPVPSAGCLACIPTLLGYRNHCGEFGGGGDTSANNQFALPCYRLTVQRAAGQLEDTLLLAHGTAPINATYQLIEFLPPATRTGVQVNESVVFQGTTVLANAVVEQDVVLTVNGTLQLTDKTTIANNAIVVLGTAVLSGDLVLTLDSAPTNGTSIDVLLAEDIDGSFDNIILEGASTSQSCEQVTAIQQQQGSGGLSVIITVDSSGCANAGLSTPALAGIIAGVIAFSVLAIALPLGIYISRRNAATNNVIMKANMSH